jgi:NAD(P)-dependent dehydrogenase (short-subunit alcohol dehydrogenase family)
MPRPVGDPVAIVTGGGRGIGQAIGRALAADGFRIAVVDLNGQAAEAAAQELRANEAVDAVAFLVSERAGYITGEALDVNGGAYID